VARHWVRRALWAGAAYFAAIFAVGFVLGTLRVLVLVPRLPPPTGETIGVLIELPIILTLSWLACGWLIGRFTVAHAWSARLLMGATALVLLLIGEVLLGYLGFGRSPVEQFRRYANLPELFGLLGQLTFAAFPCLQLKSA
jgi:hypothetical protein